MKKKQHANVKEIYVDDDIPIKHLKNAGEFGNFCSVKTISLEI